MSKKDTTLVDRWLRREQNRKDLRTPREIRAPLDPRELLDHRAWVSSDGEKYAVSAYGRVALPAVDTAILARWEDTGMHQGPASYVWSHPINSRLHGNGPTPAVSQGWVPADHIAARLKHGWLLLQPFTNQGLVSIMPTIYPPYTAGVWMRVIRRARNSTESWTYHQGALRWHKQQDAGESENTRKLEGGVSDVNTAWLANDPRNVTYTMQILVSTSTLREYEVAARQSLAHFHRLCTYVGRAWKKRELCAYSQSSDLRNISSYALDHGNAHAIAAINYIANSLGSPLRVGLWMPPSAPNPYRSAWSVGSVGSVGVGGSDGRLQLKMMGLLDELQYDCATLSENTEPLWRLLVGLDKSVKNWSAFRSLDGDERTRWMSEMNIQTAPAANVIETTLRCVRRTHKR